MFCLYVCVCMRAYVFICTTCVQCLCTLKKVLDLLELELEMVVGCHIGAGNQTQVVVFKSSSALNHRAFVLVMV